MSSSAGTLEEGAPASSAAESSLNSESLVKEKAAASEQDGAAVSEWATSSGVVRAPAVLGAPGRGRGGSWASRSFKATCDVEVSTSAGAGAAAFEAVGCAGELLGLSRETSSSNSSRRRSCGRYLRMTRGRRHRRLLDHSNEKA
eukprot:6187002-Pleurochrysis_carterae.AAC.1